MKMFSVVGCESESSITVFIIPFPIESPCPLRKASSQSALKARKPDPGSMLAVILYSMWSVCGANSM